MSKQQSKDTILLMHLCLGITVMYFCLW